MAVAVPVSYNPGLSALLPYSFFRPDQTDHNIGHNIEFESASTTIGMLEPPLPIPLSQLAEEMVKDELERNRKFEIAYHSLADRRGMNATPEGRTTSRKAWLDAGADAAKWLIDKLKTEQHPETIIGIVETITAMDSAALLVALDALESSKPNSTLAPLVEALAWMTPPSQSLLKVRIKSILDRYLSSDDIDCQAAAIQLTRILNEDEARDCLNTAMKSMEEFLREEIEDMLDERFSE